MPFSALSALVLAAAAPPASEQRPSPPMTLEPARWRAELTTYVTNDDYPVEALFNEEQGEVVFILLVGPDGRVRACTVTAASGSPSLDETTCRLMRSRARFTPARRSDGAPEFDTVRSRIAWRLTGEVRQGDAVPVHRARPMRRLSDFFRHDDFPADVRASSSPATAQFTLDITPEGRVGNCTPGRSSGYPAFDEAACRIMQQRARFTPARDRAGNPVPDRHWGHINYEGVLPPPVIVAVPGEAAPNSTPVSAPRLSATRGAVPAGPPQSSAQPTRPLQSLISADDYPAEALRNRQDGRTSYRLAIGPDGRVTGCVVLGSSGSSALDAATCRLLRARARFTPARDSAGIPTSDNYFGAYDWRLPR